MDELYYMTRLLAGGGRGWLTVGLLGGLILIFCFRPERIQRPRLLKAGCWLMALSIMVPAGISFLGSLLTLISGASFQSSDMGAFMQIAQSISCLEGVLLGASILCVLLAIMPDSPRKDPPTPARHPLE